MEKKNFGWFSYALCIMHYARIYTDYKLLTIMSYSNWNDLANAKYAYTS